MRSHALAKMCGDENQITAKSRNLFIDQQQSFSIILLPCQIQVFTSIYFNMLCI